VFTFRTPANETRAVLIENKIDAPPQPEQAARYRLRGDAGIEGGDWQSYKTCIVAPQTYLSQVTDVLGYDAQINYETLRDWYEQSNLDEARAQFKVRLLTEAIEQNRRGYTPRFDERVTRFWRDYWMVASSEFPELAMLEPGSKPTDSSWITFRSEAIGRNRVIIHKLDRGVVDLELSGAGHALKELQSAYDALLDLQGVALVPSGKSAVIRIQVPKIDRFGDCGAQIDAARAGLRAAFRLRYLSCLIHTD
jgi:hypothetical protein